MEIGKGLAKAEKRDWAHSWAIVYTSRPPIRKPVVTRMPF
ncbi:uncharacterized protein G2W53_042689 [Senna tora]|uniref:Uncharacterized protein n=1 Tax=Senna tora TaxID=362788 RepID=A0A834SJH3_9FABA|nr:uncharacterized protein G2W53_042689 [Senna tora]